MITIPAGFDYVELISLFAEIGSYIVGSMLILLAGAYVFKVLRNG